MVHRGPFRQPIRPTRVTRDAFKVGDPVEVYYNPARSATSLRGRLLKITRTTDGKTWGTRAAKLYSSRLGGRMSTRRWPAEPQPQQDTGQRHQRNTPEDHIEPLLIEPAAG